MTKFYLVKFECNWADEFDVHGVSVCDSVRLEHEQKIASENAEYEFSEIGFGTNEAFYELTMQELFECFQFVEITESTYQELKSQFTDTYCEGYGTWFRWPSTVLEDFKEMEEEEEDC
jgi:hypothetical protein